MGDESKVVNARECWQCAWHAVPSLHVQGHSPGAKCFLTSLGLTFFIWKRGNNTYAQRMVLRNKQSHARDNTGKRTEQGWGTVLVWHGAILGSNPDGKKTLKKPPLPLKTCLVILEGREFPSHGSGQMRSGGSQNRTSLPAPWRRDWGPGSLAPEHLRGKFGKIMKCTCIQISQMPGTVAQNKEMSLEWISRDSYFSRSQEKKLSLINHKV
jgi:hypothetical protein